MTFIPQWNDLICSIKKVAHCNHVGPQLLAVSAIVGVLSEVITQVTSDKTQTRFIEATNDLTEFC